MKKNLCRAALLAFALSLSLASIAQSSKPTPHPSACVEGKPCKTNNSCGGCVRCGDFCVGGVCSCG
jgi:hypothetical protein